MTSRGRSEDQVPTIAGPSFYNAARLPSSNLYPPDLAPFSRVISVPSERSAGLRP